MSKNHYQTLGLAKNCSPTDIKKAYYKLVKQHHPDHGGSLKKIKEINEAYEILSDLSKKKEYDQQQSSGFGGFGQGSY